MDGDTRGFRTLAKVTGPLWTQPLLVGGSHPTSLLTSHTLPAREWLDFLSTRGLTYVRWVQLVPSSLRPPSALPASSWSCLAGHIWMMKSCCVLHSAQERAARLRWPPKAARLGYCPQVGQQVCLAGDEGSASQARGAKLAKEGACQGGMPSLGLGGTQQVWVVRDPWAGSLETWTQTQLLQQLLTGWPGRTVYHPLCASAPPLQSGKNFFTCLREHMRNICFLIHKMG